MKDTLNRDINIGDIVCHANCGKYWKWAYIWKVLSFSKQRVRVQFTEWHESSCEPERLAIMRSEDVVFNLENDEE